MEFYSESKFDKFVHLVGFIIRIELRRMLLEHFFTSGVVPAVIPYS